MIINNLKYNFVFKLEEIDAKDEKIFELDAQLIKTNKFLKNSKARLFDLENEIHEKV